jgi:hypothetical protein
MRTFSWVIGNNLAKPEGNSRLGEIVRRHFEANAIPGCQPDEMFAHFARDVGQDFVLVVQFYLEHRSRQNRGNRSFHLNMLLTHSPMDASKSAARRKPTRRLEIILLLARKFAASAPATTSAVATATAATAATATAATTATVATTPAAAAATTTAAEPAIRALFARARFTHVHGAAVQILTVEGLDCVLSLFRSAHGDEGETF